MGTRQPYPRANSQTDLKGSNTGKQAGPRTSWETLINIGTQDLELLR